jgi:hypothetical protein
MSEELQKELKKETMLADEDRKKFISMLAEANLIEKPFELKYQEMGNIKKKLDGVFHPFTPGNQQSGDDHRRNHPEEPGPVLGRLQSVPDGGQTGAGSNSEGL